MQPVITLTTDLGENGLYAGRIKGIITRECSHAQVIDITHHIEPFNIVEAAFVLRNVYHHFAENTIHIIGVNTLDEVHTRFIAVQHKGHYFIGPDNGVFSMMLDEPYTKVMELTADQYDLATTFPIGDILAKAACRLAGGNSIDIIGKPIQGVTRKPLLQPAVYESSIRAMVIYIDTFENVFLNVTRELFDQAAKGRKAVISFRREQLAEISTHYYDVAPGELLCFFNSFNYLEIAINKGRASSLMGLKLNDIVQIDFE